MKDYLMYFFLLPFWTLCIQFSFHALSLKGVAKQNECQRLGIFFTTVGIVSLVSRDMIFAASGLVLIMLGLRMISIGLDRLDKKTLSDKSSQ